jgi:hypothetical protein
MQHLDEQETNFTIEATDRNTLHIFSNDAVWQKRIEALGVTHYREDGYGRWYKLDLKDNFNIGIHRKMKLTDDRRAELAERMRAMRATE